MFPAAAGYDRAITVFSPDGRLYQVEYAIETVRRGTLAVGIKTPQGVVLAAEERVRKLQSATATQKIFQVDDHIGVAAAGYIPDARVQVDYARVIAQSNKLVYDEAVDVETVARRIADLAQQYTQYAGVRPFGVSLIFAGISSHGAQLYLTDPSGTYLEYNAVAIGAGSDQVTAYLEQNYNENMSLEEAILLAIESIYLVSEDKVGTRHIKLAVIDTTTKKMRFLSQEEIKSYADKARTRKGSSSID
ncbi:MAG: archaeal proteasome endopeptidase complex subunit alpha [Nitrososphaerota archaeon]|nr:archaeal proteasome endopeptidase complex subunit alpha [Nitrososphaerales archaeon]MDW8044514.1 archaeal proteasome endopeptidase complex subunit alpha [Nitrososphaerota archaeon]